MWKLYQNACLQKFFCKFIVVNLLLFIKESEIDNYLVKIILDWKIAEIVILTTYICECIYQFTCQIYLDRWHTLISWVSYDAVSESQPAWHPAGALLSEFATLIDNEALPLCEKALVYVGEEKGHKGVLKLFLVTRLNWAILQLVHYASSRTHLLEVTLKLWYSREVLSKDYRRYKLDSLTQHLVILNFRPRLRGLIQESLQKLSEFLNEHKLLILSDALDARFVNQFEFDPYKDRAFIKAHISF